MVKGNIRMKLFALALVGSAAAMDIEWRLDHEKLEITDQGADGTVSLGLPAVWPTAEPRSPHVGEDGEPALQAELFSNSIAPLFEMRDRDVLPDAALRADGSLRLEIRNEALETHYIDHLAVEAVEQQYVM